MADMGHAMGAAANAAADGAEHAMPGMSHDMPGMAHGEMQSHPASETGNPGVDMQAMAPTPRLDDPGIGLRDNGRRVLTYADLESAFADPDGRAPSRTIELHLTGHMERFIWSFDGVPYSDAQPIALDYGERVRVTLVNDTMMEHPIHLHGLWSDLEDEAGEFHVRKHTVTMPPGTKRSFRVTANALGRWAFHCHLLYHMTAGMFREVRVDVSANASEGGDANASGDAQPQAQRRMRARTWSSRTARRRRRRPKEGTLMRRTSDAGARALAVVAALVAAASAAAAQAQVQPPAVTAEQRAAAFPDVGGAHAHGMLEDPLNRSIRLDELERQDADGGDLLHWNVSAWLGHTFNRLAIRSEGERRAGATERAEVQLLYSHAVARWWDVVAGAREEYDPTPRRTSGRIRRARHRAVPVRRGGDSVRERRRRRGRTLRSALRGARHEPADPRAARRARVACAGGYRARARRGLRDERRGFEAALRDPPRSCAVHRARTRRATAALRTWRALAATTRATRDS